MKKHTRQHTYWGLGIFHRKLVLAFRSTINDNRTKYGNCSMLIIQVYNHSALLSRSELTKLVIFLVECEWDVCSDCQIIFVKGMSFGVSLCTASRTNLSIDINHLEASPEGIWHYKYKKSNNYAIVNALKFFQDTFFF